MRCFSKSSLKEIALAWYIIYLVVISIFWVLVHYLTYFVYFYCRHGTSYTFVSTLALIFIYLFEHNLENYVNGREFFFRYDYVFQISMVQNVLLINNVIHWFRYYVIYRLPNIRFLDSSQVKMAEKKEALMRGPFLKVIRPADLAEVCIKWNIKSP